MNNLFAAIVGSILASGSVSALSADLTSEERLELRQRAETLVAAQDLPAQRQDDVNLNRNPGDVRLDQQRAEVKPKGAKAKPAKTAKPKATKPKREVKKKKRRSLKDLPGALVR